MQLLLRGKVMVGLERYSEETVAMLEDWELLEAEFTELNIALTRNWEMIGGDEMEKIMQQAEKGVDFWVDDEMFKDAAEGCVEAA